MKKVLLIPFFICLLCVTKTKAQDTFSIVAVDSATGEVGSAGASCVDLFNIPGIATDFLGELFPGVGAINTQASYDPDNQANARLRMNAGDSPTQIINYVVANDIGGDPTIRQYGIVRLMGGSPKTAGYTGINCLDYKNHIAGKNYCIQGNILLGKQILDSMESRFNSARGDLACRLMAALQGAKVIGADTRCALNLSSTLFAFVKVSKPTDVFGSPSFIVSVKTRNGAKIEPIDSLQILFDKKHGCYPAGVHSSKAGSVNITIYPNPCSNEFKIQIRNNNADNFCIIRNVLGQIIFEKQLKNEGIIDAHDWEKGIYSIEIINGSSGCIQKVVKI